MKRIIIISTLVGLGLPTTGSATNINVDFTAQLLATTCTITIKEDGGPAVNNTGGDDYSMTIPTVGLDKMLMLMLKPIFNWWPKIVVRVIRKLSLNFLEQPFPVT